MALRPYARASAYAPKRDVLTARPFRAHTASLPSAICRIAPRCPLDAARQIRVRLFDTAGQIAPSCSF